MWWIILLGIVLGGGLLAFVLLRATKGERRRSANWNDLHARGRLFTSQLAHLLEVETRHAAPVKPSAPRIKCAKKAGFMWRRRTSAPRDAGGPTSDTHHPV
jgi:hypothetical protein